MKRALIVTTVSGFVPQFEMSNVHILQEMGYEVHYASNFHNPHYGSDNSRLNGTGIICHQVDFVRSPFRAGKNLKAYRQLTALLREVPFSLIHCHTPMGGVLGRLAAESFRREQKKEERCMMQVLYTAHGFHFFRGAPFVNWILYYPVERWLAHYTDILITINDEDYQRALKFRLRRSADKQGRVEKVNGVGIDASFYQRAAFHRGDIRKSIGIGEEQYLLLSIGELNKNKNHKVVIQALAGSKNNACYCLCGEGKNRAALERLIRRNGLENRVFLLGYRSDVAELLKAADVFILPSYREGLSLSLQEAMACGLPAVVSDIRGNQDLITEGKGGWLIQPHDAEKLTKIIESFRKEELKAMGSYNRKKIAAYDKAQITVKMKKIYDSIDKETV